MKEKAAIPGDIRATLELLMRQALFTQNLVARVFKCQLLDLGSQAGPEGKANCEAIIAEIESQVRLFGKQFDECRGGLLLAHKAENPDVLELKN